MRTSLCLLGLVLFLGGCQTQGTVEQVTSSSTDAAYLRDWNYALTQVMVTDIVSPPVASRMYVYPNIAAYEVLAHLDPAFMPLEGQLPGLETTPEPDGVVDPMLASSVAFSRMAQALVFDGSPLAAREERLRAAAEAELPRDVYERSVAYGEAVFDAVKAFSAGDNYAQTRSMPRFVVMAEEAGRWMPTPPDYAEGLEPNWHRLRPFALASVDEFRPAEPTPFDSTEGSPFWDEMMEVYEAVNTAKSSNPEHEEIARFWDCNPLVSTHVGHLVTFAKKITPGGHWMSIAAHATAQANLDAMRASEVMTLTAIGLADGFMSCWDEKYRSCLIRPETVINQYLDPEWKPILQTPPFPEYTSGHSVVSGAASTVLTHLLGEDFAFSDTTEVRYGLPARSFASFREAADEAAMSRMYGGIHYRPAIENGVAQGRSVGRSVIERIQTRRQPVLAQHTGVAAQ